MNRINHVKLTSPDPAAVAKFLTEIAQLPEGFDIPAEHIGPAAEWNPEPSDGPFTMDDILAMRGADGHSGVIVGDEESRYDGVNGPASWTSPIRAPPASTTRAAVWRARR